MPKLVFEESALSGREIEFDGPIVLGRGSQADYEIDHPSVSRRHARIDKQGRHWVISDLGSSNGTFVDGRRVDDSVRLRDDREVCFGSLKMRFVADRPARNPIVEYVDSAIAGLRSVEIDTPDLDKEQSAEVLRAVSRRLQVVNEVGAALSQALGEDDLLPLVVDKLFEVLPGADRACVLLREDGEELTPRLSRNRKGENESFGVSRTLVKEVVDKKKGFFTLDAMQDDRFSASQTIQNLQIRSAVCVPMLVRDQVEGAIYVTGSGTGGATFSQDDVSLIAGVAAQAGLTVASAKMRRELVKRQLLEQDLALARRIQGNFLPRSVPEAEGWEFWDEYVTALAVGGDYYGYFDLPDGRLGIAVGDVSGKGMSAALYMATVAIEMRIAAVSSPSPAEILRKANLALSTSGDEGMFVTAVFVAVDRDRRRIEVASSGHPSPYLRSHDGTVRPLDSPQGTPLGVMDDSTYESAGFDLNRGDVVFVFTDGVTEAMNPSKEEFGSERLIQVLSAASGGPAGLGNDVAAAVSNFFGGEPQNDDLTLVSFGPA